MEMVAIVMIGMIAALLIGGAVAYLLFHIFISREEKIERTCPECGFENPKGHKYCGQCGYPLVRGKTEDEGLTEDNEVRARLP